MIQQTLWGIGEVDADADDDVDADADYNEDDDARVVNVVRSWGGWVGGYAILPRHLVSAKELVLEWSPMYPRLHVSHESRLHVSGK